VLETLRKTEVIGANGARSRLLDHVDIITGVSGGSFTALAYGLYGDQLFDDYEQRFLKRDVQGMLLSGVLSPDNWSALWSESWGRSEMAAAIYDELLFNGATFRDLAKRGGPLIVASATDISTGSRLSFVQSDFDLICSDLGSVPLSRAAAASSAVPLVLSPVTLNNYGGTCGLKPPSWVRALSDPDSRRPAGRPMQRYREMQAFQDGANRPYLHMVDGGLSDNLGVRSVLEMLEELESARARGRPTRLDKVKRLVVFVVNSLSIPKTDWDRKERPPNDVLILLKATGVPIDRYSYEAVELLKDITLRWKTLREIRRDGMLAVGASGPLKDRLDVPDIEIYAIDVSFQGLEDRAEFDYLNDLPTSFVLPPEAVDRLRKAAEELVLESPEFVRLLHDIGAHMPAPPAKAAAGTD
jgi:NTE family protein